MTDTRATRALDDVPVDTKVQLAALWASTMSCYIYCDYFALYIPGKLGGMLRGSMGPLGAVSQATLMGTSLLMAVPSLMIAFSVLSPARINRVVNIVVGTAYALLLVLIAFTTSWYFYRFFAVIEAVLTAMVVARAWTWPASPDTLKAG